MYKRAQQTVPFVTVFFMFLFLLVEGIREGCPLQTCLQLLYKYLLAVYDVDTGNCY